MENTDKATCESCGKSIESGDKCSMDWIEMDYFCVDCTPTWKEFASDPANFWFSSKMAFGELEYHNEETARRAISKHLKNGGSMGDKVGLIQF